VTERLIPSYVILGSRRGKFGLRGGQEYKANGSRDL
jgi:hypothetical protein